MSAVQSKSGGLRILVPDVPLTPMAISTPMCPDMALSPAATVGEQPFMDVGKVNRRPACARVCFIACLVAVLLTVGIILGGGIASAIIIPVMAKQGDCSSEVDPMALSANDYNDSDDVSAQALLLGESKCAFGCPPPVTWCPPGAECRCERCTEGNDFNPDDGPGFRMRIYAQQSAFAAVSERASCLFKSVTTGEFLRKNCTEDDDPSNEAVGWSENETDAFDNNNGSVADRIQGGKETTIKTYPHQALVQFGNGVICGGSILKNDWVLTAGHCCYRKSVANCNIRVMFGQTSMVGYNPRQHGGTCKAAAQSKTHRCVAKAYTHPKFNSGTMAYDVCLLRLMKPLTGTAWKAISITSSVPSDGTSATAIGWGYNKWAGTSMRKLQVVQLGTQSSTTMRAGAWGEFVSEGSIGAQAPGKGTCSGDSGGPLLITEGGARKVVGVSSFVIQGDCASSLFPNIFWRASYTDGWLATTMKRKHPCQGG